MAFLNNLSIGGKIFFMLALITFFECLIVAFGVSTYLAADSRIHRIVDIDINKVFITGKINRSFLQIHRDAEDMLAAISTEELNRCRFSYEAQKEKLEQAMEDLDKLLSDDEKEKLAQLRARYSEFVQANEEIEARLFKGGQADPPLRVNRNTMMMARGRSLEAFDRVEAALAELRSVMESNLSRLKTRTAAETKAAIILTLVVSIFVIAIGALLGLLISRSIVSNLSILVGVAGSIAAGELDNNFRVDSRDETGKLADSLGHMQSSLKSSRDELESRHWMRNGIVHFNDLVRTEHDLDRICSIVLTEICTYLDAKAGALYLSDEKGKEPVLKLKSRYAFVSPPGHPERFAPGEGFPGQAALERRRITIRDIPEGYVKIVSGTGEAGLRVITVIPFLFEEKVKGVVELGSLRELSGIESEYLNRTMSILGIIIEAVETRDSLSRSLAETQTLNEELRTTNEELEEQSVKLRRSEEKLREQQEELQAINEELEERNEELRHQKSSVEQANADLEKTRAQLEKKASELATTSRYKSEFLANMSHELRTPLNSLLLLSKILADNEERTLTAKQVEAASVIYGSGNDLLNLINDILDLARIEAGKMEVSAEKIRVWDLAEHVRRNFSHLASEKGLELRVAVRPEAPELIETDRKRLEQVLRNLIYNAIKFTDKGGVDVGFGSAPEDREGNQGRSGGRCEITVKDTGVGIPQDKQSLVFEAFHQLDGGASRKYGGTGLGLSITRELVSLLGGEIELSSEPGSGSTFTVRIPVEFTGAESDRSLRPVVTETGAQAAAEERKPVPAPAPPVPDDRNELKDSKKIMLIIEDDPNFAKALKDLCNQKGFRCLIARTGEEGLDLARKYSPSAIILDIQLPGMDGWSVLDRLKDASELRHIPVHIISVEEASMDAVRRGALGHLTKPVTREKLDEALYRLEETFSRTIKELLIIEDDENLRKSFIHLIGNGDVHCDTTGTGAEALEKLAEKKYDCVILDLGLPDMTGFELLQEIERSTEAALPPVIIYTGRDLTKEQESELLRHSDSIIIKGVRSEERLLDETSLFLHRVVGNMTEGRRKIITSLHNADMMFRDKKVLVVDDDMRNVFALSKVFEQKGIQVLKAEDGEKALRILNEEADVDLVLMDIMMPRMDGYETIRRIRQIERLRRLPIIALTAKAMRDDRARAVEAGASDYISKPVDIQKLFSMMRVWLYE